MKGVSRFLPRSSRRAPAQPKCGTEKSQITTSQARFSRVALIACGVSTRSKLTSYPPPRNSRITSSVSSSESSTIRTLRGVPIDPPSKIHHQDSNLPNRLDKWPKIETRATANSQSRLANVSCKHSHHAECRLREF